jgi:hypothetical protein
MDVADIRSGTALNKQANDPFVTSQRGLMQRRRMRMRSLRIVPVRILAGVEQQAHDFRMSVLRRPSHGEMPFLWSGARERSARFVNATSRSSRGKVHSRASTDQSVNGLKLTVPKRRPHGTLRIGPVIAQEYD